MSDSTVASKLRRLATGRTPLAVAAAPLFFVYFGLFLPAAAAARFSPGFTAGAGVILAAASAAVFAVERWLARTHALGAASQIRELAAIEAGAALFAWAALRVPLAALVLTGEFWATMIAAGLVFALSAGLRRRTALQEFFVSAVARMAEAKREGPESDTVAAVTRELSVEAGESATALLSLRHWLIFFVLWLVGLLVVTGWVLHAAGVAEQIGICASIIVFLSALISVGRLSEEQRILTLGLVPERAHRPVATGVGALLFAAAALIAGALALQHALISRAALAAFGAWILWLLSLIPSRSPSRAAPPPRPMVVSHPLPELSQRLHSIAPVHGSQLVAAILTYLAWGAAAAAALGLLWLLFAPLFRMRRDGVAFTAALRARGRRIAEGLRRWVSEIRGAFAGIRDARGAGGTPSAAAAAGRRRPKRRRGGRLLALTAGNRRRFSAAFRRLARWGGERGAAFSPSLGPREYTSLLASRVPLASTELERISELYERQLFSPTPLSGRERASYYKMIREVVRGGST